jgi:gliding motility-associated-like protein
MSNRVPAGICCGLLAILLTLNFDLKAQFNNAPLKKNFSESFITPEFIQNNGQFDAWSANNTAVNFGVMNSGVNILIGGNSVQYYRSVAKKEDDEHGKRREKHEREFEEQRLTMKFLNANSNITFTTADPCTDYFSCIDPNNKNASIVSNCFKTITALNVYPGIDVVYKFHSEGSLEYSFLVHPGADVSLVKIKWDGAEGISLDANGNVVVTDDKLGVTTDHAPASYYETSGGELASSFELNADNTVGISIANYNHNQTVVIDPWSYNPAFVGNNAAYDIMQDPSSGMIFLYGGSNPYVVKKYNNVGTLQWTFSTMANGYYGDFCLEPGTGNIFCVYGPWGDYCIKVSSAGALMWNVNSGNTYSREIYRVFYNPVALNLSIIGMNMPTTQTPMALNIDPSNGAYSAPVMHPTCTYGETRGMCVDANGDIYAEVWNSVGSPNPAADNLIWHLNSGLTNLNSVQDGYLLDEVDPSQTDSWFSGYNGMAVGCDLYSFDGITLKRWDKNTLALLGSVTIPGGVEYNTSGLCVDACGNVYVGSPAGVREYDSGLNYLTMQATSGPVYDVCMGLGVGEVLACGSGFFASVTFPTSSCTSTTTITSLPSNTCACSGQASISVQASQCAAGTFTYQWFPTGGTNDTAFNLCPGNYTCYYTNTTTGAVDSATVTVAGNASSMSATSTSTNPTCFGSTNGSITANPSGGIGPYTYLWTPGGQTTQTISGVGAGTYNVDVTDSAGCVLTLTITLTQPAGMNFTTANTATSCTACNGTATVNVSGGTGPFTYSWNSVPTQNTSTATSLCQGTYICTITDAAGCMQDTSVVVPLSGGLTSTASIATPITCFGSCNGSLTATPSSGTGPYIYSWNTNPVQNTQVATGLCAGTYEVEITDANGCSSTSTIALTEPSALALNTISPLTICAGKCTSLSVAVAGGSPAYTYTWNPGAMPGNNLSVCPPVTTTYTATVTDANGCQAMDSILVVVNPLPAVAFTADTLQGCAPVCVTFTNNTPNTQSLLWEYGNGNQNSVGYQCYTPGTYDVTLVITGTNGCIDSLTNLAYINSWLSPTAGFVASPTQNILMEANFCFAETAQNESTYLWNFNDPSDLTNSTDANPCHTYTDTGYFCVQQIVYSANGCTDTTTNCVEVIPDPATIYVPNSFTPTGNGLNDIFMPVGTNINEDKYHFMVFDRWGNLIFDTHTWGTGWDGTYKGNKCQIDTYVWKVDAQDLEGYNHRLIGHVNLIR